MTKLEILFDYWRKKLKSILKNHIASNFTKKFSPLNDRLDDT